MKYNGEEEYTEKVDSFSFGMFLYELLTLRLPFENHECIKDLILDGRRPAFNDRDLFYPSYLLDLMTTSWSQHPKYRPAASQIVSVVTAPEFIHLLDVISLSENCAVLSAAAVEKDAGREVWLSRIGKLTDVLFCDEHSWLDYRTLSSVETITVTYMCVIYDNIWLGDSKALIHVYNIYTYNEVTVIRLYPDEMTPTAVSSMCLLRAIDYVAISSTSGRLWICSIDGLQIREIRNNGNAFLCVAPVNLVDSSSNSCELWCGQTEGSVCIISFKEGIITSQDFINHYNYIHESHERHVEKYDVFQLVTEGKYALSYLYPGNINMTVQHIFN